MTKLLRAGFARLFRDKIFWICSAVMAAFGVYIALDQYIASKRFDMFNPTADEIIFIFLAYGGMVYAIFCALFVGREYSDGTIRNKFIVGHTHASIYVSNLIVTAVGNIIISLAYILPALVIGIPALGWFQRPISYIAVTFIALLILAAAYAAVFTMLSLLNSNKAVNAVVCIALATLLLMAAVTMRDQIYYASGFGKQILSILIDLSPAGQSMQLTMFSTDKPEILALYSIGLTAALTAIGIVLFKRKDIK